MNQNQKLEYARDLVKKESILPYSEGRHYNARLSSIKNRLRLKLLEKEIDKVNIEMNSVVPPSLESGKTFEW